MNKRLIIISVIAAATVLLSGCRDFIAEELQQARQERNDALETVATLKAEITTLKENVTEVQQQLDDYQTEADEKIAAAEAARQEAETMLAETQAEKETLESSVGNLEAELAKWQSGIYPGVETPPEPPPALQEEDLRYRGQDNKLTYIHLSMVSADWNGNKVSIKWELKNTSTRKIYLNLLSVKARDQMHLRGERTVNDSVTESEVSIYPGLQDKVDSPWPGEIVRFTTTWDFGPLSEEIIVSFLLRDIGEIYPSYIEGELFPEFILER